jgi:lipoyl(octanoyl) transferase
MELRDLGFLAYREALAVQRRCREELLDGRGPEVLLLVEHPPVLTLGRSAGPEDLGLSQEEWSRKGVEVVRVERGGKATYHGPGQAVAYPIVDLRRRGRDLRAYVRTLEEAGVLALARFGITARAGRDPVGVFVGERKIASIGVSVSRWVTQHGIALNVATDLSVYRYFTPCGLTGVSMTRLADLVPATVAQGSARLAEALLESLGPLIGPAAPEGAARGYVPSDEAPLR